MFSTFVSRYCSKARIFPIGSGVEDQISENTILPFLLHTQIARCLTHSKHIIIKKKKKKASGLLSRGGGGGGGVGGDKSILFFPPEN